MNSKAPGYSFQVEMLIISIFKRNPLVSEFKVLQKYYKGLRVTKCWAFPWNNQIKSASKILQRFLTLQSAHMSKDTHKYSLSIQCTLTSYQPSKQPRQN